jgi:hypothetical protein
MGCTLAHPNIMQSIWYRNEIKIADELMELAPKLRDEFLAYHTDFFTTFEGGISYAATNPLAILDEKEKNDWKVEGLRYALPEQKIEQNFFLQPRERSIFPTAAALTKKYIAHIGCSGYSVLEAGGDIKRHMDIENRLHNTIRIHIPLIIPEGDVYFEVNGMEFEWSNIFGFDNGQLHSAHNKSQKRRLIYIIDFTRSFLEIPSYGMGSVGS